MSNRKHGDAPRNKQPDVVRKAGPHIKQEKFEPVACTACGGTGFVEVGDGDGYAASTCQICEGTGEV
jgi:DnaJ-class molecular chaperone